MPTRDQDATADAPDADAVVAADTDGAAGVTP